MDDWRRKNLEEMNTTLLEMWICKTHEINCFTQFPTLVPRPCRDRWWGPARGTARSTPNFERLVLFCMDSYDSETGFIFQRFSRSTRCTNLRTAQISKIQLKIVNFFTKLNIEYSNFFNIWHFFDTKFSIFLSKFDEFWSEFRGKPQRMTKSVEILRKFHEIIRKIAEIVGISEIMQFSDWIIQSGP